MTEALLAVELRDETDLVLVRQRTRQLTELLGFAGIDQTRLATAVSEIARNALLYAGGGRAQFVVGEEALVVTVSDHGPGIRELDSVLQGTYRSKTGLGKGILGVRGLMDHLRIETAPGKGTTVEMTRALPRAASRPTPVEVRAELARRGRISPLDEVKWQNAELLRALDEERRAKRALHEREALLDALFASAPVGLAMLDRELRFQRLNQALATMNRVPLGDHLGRTFAEVVPEHAPELGSLLQRALEGGGAPATVIRGLAPRAPGELQQWRMVGWYPVHGAQGDLMGLGGVVVDMSEQKDFEEKLQTAIQVREDVLAVVSHDLRNLVTVIQLSAAGLGDTKPTQRIKRAAKQMSRMISDLLEMASISVGRLSLEKSSQSFEQLMREAVDLCILPSDKPLHLVTQVELPDVVLISCDRMRIFQVFANLLGNAVKFARPGDTITVRAEAQPDAVKFAVIDTGPGIAPDDLPHVFDRYWSAAAHKNLGTGLGLFIARGIIEAHGGRIWAENTPGGGTTMAVTLPRA